MRTELKGIPPKKGPLFYLRTSKRLRRYEGVYRYSNVTQAFNRAHAIMRSFSTCENDSITVLKGALTTGEVLGTVKWNGEQIIAVRG